MPLYSKIGGIRIGSSYWLAANYTIPLAELKMDERGVHIKYLFREIYIPRASVERVHKKWGLFGPGVRIVHTSEEVDPFVLFWTYKAGELLEKFREFDYPVQES